MSGRPQESTALVQQAEVSSLTRAQRSTVADVAGLWASSWSTIDKLEPQDRLTVARVIVSAFPEFGPLEILKYFEMIGGKLYDTAEFWLHQAAQHPNYRGAELVELEPGTEDWIDLIGKRQDPAKIAAAVKCTAHRFVSQRAGTGEEILRTEVEAGYSAMGDAVLSETKWMDVKEAKNRAEAEALVLERKAAGAIVSDVFFQAAKGNRPGGWVARLLVPREDFFALALKTARTRASRRCLRRMFSLAEARKTTALTHANRIIEAKLGQDPGDDSPVNMLEGAGAPLGIRAGGRPAPTLRDAQEGYGDAPELRHAEEQLARRAAPAAAPRATSTHDEAADRAPLLISEEDRRKLYVALDDKVTLDLGPNAHEALHELIRRTKQLPPNAPASTKDLTYPEWEKVMEAIDVLPFRGDADEGGAQ